ncbi:MAG: glucosaminidase domain-containing protein [Lachnospiraceae bacterium]|nr:glucosaminidase domain-containing protein [Lachnospiraceae bacterium]
MKKQKRFFVLLLALILIFSSTPVSAASLKIKKSGKATTYTGKQLKVTYNGTNIPITSYPGLTLSGYNMIPYYYVFVKNGPKMSYSYNSNKTCLTLTYNGTTVKLYNKKKTAYVNGVKKTLGIAPIFVTFVKSNKKVFMIPAKAVCGYFGFTYSYSSSKKTITITGTDKNTVSSDSSSSVNSQSASSTQATSFKSMSTSKFIKTIGPLAQADAKESGVMASVTMAQAILESGWGKSDLAQKANNLFGMKTSLSGNTWNGSTWDGSSKYTKTTAEYDSNNKKYYVTASFRKYPSVEKSIGDHSAYLTHAKNGSSLRYSGLTSATTYKKQLTIIKNGGYATSSTYVNDLCKIITQYNLDDWD